MKGGPSQAQINAQKKEAEKQQKAMAKALARQQAESNKILKSMGEIQLPKQPKLEPAPPPAQQTSSDTIAAQEDVMAQARKRYGLTQTRVAGETGGYLGGGTTKLGGQSLLSA